MGGLAQQWDAVTSAPLLYLGALIAVVALVWAFIHFLYRHRLEGFKERLDGLRDEVARLKESPRPAPQWEALPEGQPTATEAATKPPALKQNGDGGQRVFLGSHITGEHLRSLFKSQTAHQATAATAPYIGKWLRVEGTVNNVYNDTGRWTVLADSKDPRDPMGAAMMHFGPDEAAKVEILQIGETVYAEGKLRSVEPFWVILEQARIIDRP